MRSAHAMRLIYLFILSLMQFFNLNLFIVSEVTQEGMFKKLKFRI